MLAHMNKNKKSADIWYDFETKSVEYKNYEPQPLLRAFLIDNPTWEDFKEFAKILKETKNANE